MPLMASRVLYRATFPASTSWKFSSCQRGVNHQHACSRAFSSTGARNNAVLDLVTAPPLFLLETIHAAWVPWWAAIPATAVVTRGVLGYFLVSKDAHYRRKLKRAVLPLASATSMTALRASSHRARVDRVEIGEFESFRAREEAAGRIQSEFSSNTERRIRWVSNFGVLLSTTEAIRMKIGANEGLLSFMLSIWDWITAFLWKPLMDASPAMQRADTVPQPLDALSQQVTTVAELASRVTSEFVNALPPGTESSAYDPSIMLEGLSFCQDLSAHDPTGYLSRTLLLCMLLNVVIRPRSVPFHKQLTAIDWLYMSLAVFMWRFAELPAGIYLYLITSGVIGKLVSVYLDVRDMPPTAIGPCKRFPRKNTLYV